MSFPSHDLDDDRRPLYPPHHLRSTADFYQPRDGSQMLGISYPKITPERRKKLILSYAPDWILTIILAAIFFSLDKVDGFRRDFSLDDTSLRYTFTVHERVPDWLLYVICFGAPLVLQPIVNLLTIRSWWDLHVSTFGLVLSLSLTGAITQLTKITVGRPRPDVISRCQPISGSFDPNNLSLSNTSICTQTDIAILRDGFRSFFSGHSSLSFAGLGFFSFYIAGKVHLFDRHGFAGKAWLSLAPLAGAALVAISRTMDYRHHWHDVLVGSAVGLLFAYFSYRLYYPSLKAENCHKPYSPRIKEPVREVLPLHRRDLEDESDHGHVAPPGVQPAGPEELGVDVVVAPRGYSDLSNAPLGSQREDWSPQKES